MPRYDRLTEIKICTLLALDELGAPALVGVIARRAGFEANRVEANLYGLRRADLVKQNATRAWDLTAAGRLRAREIASTPVELA